MVWTFLIYEVVYVGIVLILCYNLKRIERRVTMSIYITGDSHGKYPKLLEFTKLLKKGDYIIVCGDWGYLWDNDESEQNLLDDIERTQEWTMLFVDGNHENFPAIYSYPEEIWCAGKVHRIRSNIIHLCRSQVYTINDKKIFTMGGGYSVDSYMRVPGISVWPEDEMPSNIDFEEADKNLDKHNRKVDFIITHTAPYETLSLFRTPHPKEERLNRKLEEIRINTEYKHWFMGHLHEDTDTWRNQHLLLWDYFQIDGDDVSRLYLIQSEQEEFDSIRSGKRDIEIRTLDQRARNINVGDYFVYYDIPIGDYVKERCVALHEASSFEELLEHIDNNERFGFNAEDSKEYVLQKIKEQFLPDEDKKKGVVGIEIEYIKPKSEEE